MNLFQTIKTAVTVKQAAALYGLPITTTGMTRCPFHEDHTPSMKLNDTYYYCFGCEATGDVIDLTPAYSTLAAYRLPGNWFRILTSARTSPHPARLHYPSRPLPLQTPSRRMFLTVSGSSMTTIAFWLNGEQSLLPAHRRRRWTIALWKPCTCWMS